MTSIMTTMNNSPTPRNRARVLLTVWIGACALTACMSQSGEVELVPASREGMFYTSIAEAQRDAETQSKHILLDMWRPG